MKTLSILIAIFVIATAKEHDTPVYPHLNGVYTSSNLASYKSINNHLIPFVSTFEQGITHNRKNNWIYKEKLDSAILVGTLKQHFTYNNNGNVTKAIYLVTDSSGLWVYFNKYEYNYDNNNDTVFVNISSWESGQWINDQKHEYVYDSSDKITCQLTQSWENDKWVNSRKQEFTYNNNGDLVLYFSYKWASDQWENDVKNEYVLNNFRNVSQVMVYSWDSTAWGNYEKIEYTYDNNDKVILSLWYFWTDTLWENSYKIEYTYNSQGNTTLFAEYVWEETQWVNNEKTVYNYDSFDNMVLDTTYVWDVNQWKNDYRVEVNYDLSISYSEVAYPVFNSPELSVSMKAWYGTLNNRSDSTKSFYWTYINWEESSHQKLYFSPFIVPILNDQQLSSSYNNTPLTIHSKRSNSCLSIVNHSKLEIDLSIYSINGKVTKRCVVPKNGMLLDISHLASGVYFVKYTVRNTASVITSFVKR